MCAALTALLVLGAALSALWIGLPLVLFALAACARLAEIERRQANRLLDAHIAPLARPPHHEGTLWRRAISSLTDRDNWRDAGAGGDQAAGRRRSASPPGSSRSRSRRGC